MGIIKWWKIAVRRQAIRAALQRPMPEQLEYADKQNNNYEVRIGDRNGDLLFRPRTVHPKGIEGWCHVGQIPRTEACIPNNQLVQLPFKINHYYAEFLITSKSGFAFLIKHACKYAFFSANYYRLRQHFFNKTKLARHDRMKVLQHAFEKTVQDRYFRFSLTELPSNLYGMRFWGRRDYSIYVSYYHLILESLHASGDLKKFDQDYSITPKAMATLNAYATEQERHCDNVKNQRRIAVITFFLAALAAAQVIATFWSEVNPDPEYIAPSALRQLQYPILPPIFYGSSTIKTPQIENTFE